MTGVETAYGKCPECGKYAIHLATTGVGEFYGDRDDDNDEHSVYSDDAIEPQDDVRLFAHICFECGHLEDVGIEEPRDKVIDTREYQWTSAWPTEPGHYWFYGWISRILRDRPQDMLLVHAQMSHVGLLASTQGRTIYEQDCCGQWTPATLPSPPRD